MDIGTIHLARHHIASMSSIVWLCLAGVFVAIVALTGAGPKGAKPVANTRLMGMARYVLIVGVVVCAAMGLFGAFRH
ncbi:MAG: hypothetical protein QOI66_3927 [Myxococcales bacterium]|jgi:hypothetical protein|nr:hypothetical protein [Myxococcales bacterium]